MSPLHPSPVMELRASSHRSSTQTSTPPLYTPISGQTPPVSPPLASVLQTSSDEPESRIISLQTSQDLPHAASLGPGLGPSLDPGRGLVMLGFPSTSWSSCPSSPTTSSVAQRTLSPAASRLGSRCWPVLPPISPVRGENRFLPTPYGPFTLRQRPWARRRNQSGLLTEELRCCCLPPHNKQRSFSLSSNSEAERSFGRKAGTV